MLADDDSTLEGLPVVRHHFGSGAAVVVVVSFLALAAAGYLVHERRTLSRATLDSDLPAHWSGTSIKATHAQLEQLNEEQASQGSVLLAPPLSVRLGDKLVSMLPEGASALTRAYVERRIRGDHDRAVRGDIQDVHAFLMLHGQDGYAIAEGYVSSAKAMVAAADAGQDFARAAKPFVDAALSRVKAEDPDSARDFLRVYGSNAYAKMRGYVSRALAFEDAAAKQSEEREEMERRRQHTTEWTWD